MNPTAEVMLHNGRHVPAILYSWVDQLLASGHVIAIMPDHEVLVDPPVPDDLLYQLERDDHATRAIVRELLTRPRIRH